MKSTLLLALVAIALCACGGDGGSSLPTPLAQPQTFPSLPKTTDAVALSPLAGGSSSQCGWYNGRSALTFNDLGQALVIWCENVAGVDRLNATWMPSRQTAMIIPALTSNSIFWNVQSVGGSRFVMVHNDGAGDNMVAQSLDFSGPTPVVSARYALPPGKRGTLIKDVAGGLHFMVQSQAMPFPVISLDGGLSLDVAAPQGIQFFQQDETQWVQSRSISPRALWGVKGYLNSSEALPDAYASEIYVADVDLSSSMSPTVLKVTQVPFISGSARKSCYSRYGNSAPAYLSTGAGKWAAAWMQWDRISNKCVLYVNGVRVSDDSEVGAFELASDGDALIVVWAIAWGSNPPRIVWSRQNPVTLQWSAPAGIAPAFDSEALFQIPNRFSSNRNGTLVVAWEPCYKQGSGCTLNSSNRVVSKFVNGQWIHQTSSLAGAIDEIAISASGEGVAIVRCQSLGCTPSVAAISF